MEDKDKPLLSRNWRVFQAYSLQIALGCLSAFYIMRLESVKQVFMSANLVLFYAIFSAVIVVIGIIASIFSGGVGLLRLLNLKKIVKMLDKEDNERV